jgi:hypothetical protein
MALHPQLLGLQPEGEPDELGEVQDRHVELAADDALGQRLLEVEVEVAQRAGRDQAVGVGVDRVAQVAPGLLERGVLVHRDDREAAALVRAGVLDHRAAQRLDDHAQVAVARALGGVDAEAVDRAHDVAAIEGADLEVGQRPADPRAQLVEADLLDQEPEEVLVGQALLVVQALGGEVLVDVRPVLGVGVQALLALALCALAGRADVHHQLGVLDALGQREGPGVERVGQLLVVLGDDAGAAARGPVELDELDVEQRSDLRHRAVELRREPAAHAARPVRDPHAPLPSAGEPPGADVIPSSPLTATRWGSSAPSSSSS